MRRQIIKMFCACLLLALAPAWAQQPQHVEQEPPQQGRDRPVPNRGALFRVDGSGHTLYLFGTMHVGAPDFYPLEPRVAAALGRAGALALEADPQIDPALALTLMQRYGMYADGAGPAIAAIDPAFRPRLERLLARYRMPPEALAPMKPWVLATVLTVSEFSMLGYQAELGVDTYLAQQARARKIPVLELESAAGQMALFDRMPAPAQLRFLEETIVMLEQEIAQPPGQARRTADAWRTADAAAFDQLAREVAADPSSSARFIQTVLLDERNPGLADGIAALLAREHDSMAAIGVLHLVGTNSVPELLRQRGLRVERIY